MLFDAGFSTDLTLAYKGTPVKVTLEFPGQPDSRAEEEFTDRLKAVYLEKLEEKPEPVAGQGGKALPPFYSIVGKEGWDAG